MSNKLYSSTQEHEHQMQVNGELHALADLPLAPIGYEAH
jgi:hypothetical protein